MLVEGDHFRMASKFRIVVYIGLHAVLGQNGRGQNGTDKISPTESSINQAIQPPLTI